MRRETEDIAPAPATAHAAAVGAVSAVLLRVTAAAAAAAAGGGCPAAAAGAPAAGAAFCARSDSSGAGTSLVATRGWQSHGCLAAPPAPHPFFAVRLASLLAEIFGRQHDFQHLFAHPEARLCDLHRLTVACRREKGKERFVGHLFYMLLFALLCGRPRESQFAVFAWASEHWFPAGVEKWHRAAIEQAWKAVVRGVPPCAVNSLLSFFESCQTRTAQCMYINILIGHTTIAFPNSTCRLASRAGDFLRGQEAAALRYAAADAALMRYCSRLSARRLEDSRHFEQSGDSYYAEFANLVRKSELAKAGLQNYVTATLQVAEVSRPQPPVRSVIETFTESTASIIFCAVPFDFRRLSLRLALYQRLQRRHCYGIVHQLEPDLCTWEVVSTKFATLCTRFMARKRQEASAPSRFPAYAAGASRDPGGSCFAPASVDGSGMLQQRNAEFGESGYWFWPSCLTFDAIAAFVKYFGMAMSNADSSRAHAKYTFSIDTVSKSESAPEIHTASENDTGMKVEDASELETVLELGTALEIDRAFDTGSASAIHTASETKTPSEMKIASEIKTASDIKTASEMKTAFERKTALEMKSASEVDTPLEMTTTVSTMKPASGVEPRLDNGESERSGRSGSSGGCGGGEEGVMGDERGAPHVLLIKPSTFMTVADVLAVVPFVGALNRKRKSLRPEDDTTCFRVLTRTNYICPVHEKVRFIAVPVNPAFLTPFQRSRLALAVDSAVASRVIWGGTRDCDGVKSLAAESDAQTRRRRYPPPAPDVVREKANFGAIRREASCASSLAHSQDMQFSSLEAETGPPWPAKRAR